MNRAILLLVEESANITRFSEEKILDLSPAKWIWLPSRRTLPNTFVCFRKEISLDQVPRQAMIQIAADSRFLLRVNGHRVLWGPAPSDPRAMEVDEVDIAPWLKPGRNCISALVLFYGHSEGTWPFGKPGFILRGQPGLEMLHTSAAWRCQVDRGRAPGTAPRWFLRSLQERWDARLTPQGWEEAGFDDSGWMQAQEFTLPPDRSPSAGGYGRYEQDWWMVDPAKSTLLARSIPLMWEEVVELGTPAAAYRLEWQRSPDDWFENRSPGTFTISPTASTELEFDQMPGVGRAFRFDLPIERIGFPGVEIEAPEGTQVELISQESMKPDDQWLDTHFYLWSRLTCREGLNSFEAFDYEGLRHLQVHIHGPAGRVRLRRAWVRAREASWPHEPKAVLKDPHLQRLMSANIETLRNSCQDIVVDGMARERQQYSGDCSHQLRCLWALTGEKRTPARFLRTFARGQMLDGVFADSWPAGDRLQRLWQRQMGLSVWGPIIDHSIGFLHDHFNHWNELGDLGPARDNWDRLRRFVDFLERSAQADGLLDPVNTGSNAVWIDHIAFRSQAEKALPLNLYASSALTHAMAPLALALGDKEEAQRSVALGQSLLAGCVGRFWNKQRLVFENSPDGRTDDRSLATSILFDQCPGGAWHGAAALLAAPDASVGLSYPANTPWLYWGQIRAGRADAALADMKRWVNLPSVVNNGTIQEMWDVELGSIHLMSHCAAGPLVVLLHGIAGLRPLSTGFGRYELRPHLGSLEEVQVDMWTPHGRIRLEADQDRLAVEAAPGGEGFISLDLVAEGRPLLAPMGRPSEGAVKLEPGKRAEFKRN